jgi:cysteine-rich repeat protein
MRSASLALALCPFALACSFDATGDSTPTQASGDPGTSTTTATTTTTTTSGTTTAGPTTPTTTGDPDETTTTTTSPTLTTAMDTSTGTTDPIDPTTSTASSSEESSSSSGPPPAMCGDNNLDDGEECDDGNDVDTDACTNICQHAECGDGLVEAGVDECDDGNMDEFDGCTAACKAPTCSDAAHNGGESDVDCGGSCKDCDIGQMCNGSGDCEYKCDGVCLGPANCAQIDMAGQPSGTYDIDPDGMGPGQPFAVWCEQVQFDGGWTLVLKADGSKTSFAYTDAKWGEAAAWMPDPDLSRDETKLLSYSTVAVKEVLVGMEAPVQNMGNLTLTYIRLDIPDAASLHAAIEPDMFQATTNPEAEWRALVPMASLQSSCKRQGLNPRSDNAMPQNFARVRIGIIANEGGTCDSHNSWIGVGGGTLGPNCNVQSTATTGNRAGCQADMGDKDTKGFAVVYVR